MVHDFALWRGDLAFVTELMPNVRAAIEAHRRTVDDRGIFHALHGWNFTDWVPGWDAGTPPGIVQDGEEHPDWPGPGRGVSAVLQLQLALVARQVADLESWVGESDASARYSQLADELLEAADEAFYDADRRLYADDLDHTAFCEHAQALALLAGAKYGETAVRTMLQDPPEALARTTVYFDHYLSRHCTRSGGPTCCSTGSNSGSGCWTRACARSSNTPNRPAATATRGAHTRCTTTSRRCSVSGQQPPE